MPEHLRELLEERVRTAPDKIFLFSEHDGRRYSYAEFDRAVNRTARLLAGHDVGKGDVVSLLLPNGAEYVIAYFACFKLGALAGPVNALLKAAEIEYAVAHADARALLYHSDFTSHVESIRPNLAALRAAVLFDDEAGATRGLPDDGEAFRQIGRAHV